MISAPIQQTSKDLAQNTNDRAHLHHSRGWQAAAGPPTRVQGKCCSIQTTKSAWWFIAFLPHQNHGDQSSVSLDDFLCSIFWGRVEEFTWKSRGCCLGNVRFCRRQRRLNMTELIEILGKQMEMPLLLNLIATERDLKRQIVYIWL